MTSIGGLGRSMGKVDGDDDRHKPPICGTDHDPRPEDCSRENQAQRTAPVGITPRQSETHSRRVRSYVAIIDIHRRTHVTEPRCLTLVPAYVSWYRDCQDAVEVEVRRPRLAFNAPPSPSRRYLQTKQPRKGIALLPDVLIQSLHNMKG